MSNEESVGAIQQMKSEVVAAWKRVFTAIFKFTYALGVLLFPSFVVVTVTVAPPIVAADYVTRHVSPDRLFSDQSLVLTFEPALTVLFLLIWLALVIYPAVCAIARVFGEDENGK